jgi:hypothetical protein
MFAQIIRGNVSDPSAIDGTLDRWSRELAPGAKGWLGTTGGTTADGQLFIMVRFESEEAARANSERPEQGQFWLEMSKQFDGEPSFQDSNEVYVDTRGDVDSAGFVQVMVGQTSDPERTIELMAGNREDRVALRPEVLGQVAVAHGEGKFTFVNYFTTEAEAREGERKPMPPKLAESFKELQALAVGQAEFLDLEKPRLDSPR